MNTKKHYAYVLRVSSPSGEYDITGDAYEALDEKHVLLSALRKHSIETNQHEWEIEVRDFSCFETTS